MCLESCTNPDLGCDPRIENRLRNKAAKAAHRVRVKARKQSQTAQAVADSNLNRSEEVVLTDRDLSVWTITQASHGGSV